MGNAKTWASAGRFDPFNSTFKIKTLFDNGFEMVGYTKPLLDPEPPDKIIVIEGAILRLVQSGYVFGKTKKYGNTTTKMEIFLNGTFFGKSDDLLLSLYKDRYTFSKSGIEYFNDKRIQTTLSRLYTQAKEGNIVTKSLQHKKPYNSIEKLFSIEVPRFKNQMELSRYILQLHKDGHPPGRILNFHESYHEKYFSKVT